MSVDSVHPNGGFYCNYYPCDPCKITQIACGILVILGSIFVANFYDAQLGDYSLLVGGLGTLVGLPLILCHPNKTAPLHMERRQRYVDVTDIERKIVQATHHLFHRTEVDSPVAGVKYHQSSDTHKVFEVETRPQSVFKTSILEGDIEKRYKKMEEARAIVANNNLRLLVVPDVELARVSISTGWLSSKQVLVLVEKRYELEIEETVYTRIEEEGQEEAIFQTAVFTILAKWNDLSRSNFPRIKTSNQRLISDVESMGTPKGDAIGLFGGEAEEEIIEGRSVVDQSPVRYRQNARLGLMGCIGVKYFPQIRRAIQHCQRNDLLPLYDESVKKQEGLIVQEADLPEFYQKRKVQQGDEPLHLPQEFPEEDKSLAIWMLERANEAFKKHIAKYAQHPMKYIRQFTIIYKDAPSEINATKAKIDALAQKFIIHGLFHHVIDNGNFQLRISA